MEQVCSWEEMPQSRKLSHEVTEPTKNKPFCSPG